MTPDHDADLEARIVAEIKAHRELLELLKQLRRQGKDKARPPKAVKES